VIIAGYRVAGLLWAAGAVIAFGCSAVVVLLVIALLLGAVGLHLFGLRAHRAVGIGMGIAGLLLLIILRTGLLALVLAVVVLVLGLRLDLSLGQVQRREQFPRRAGEPTLVVLRRRHLRQGVIRIVAQSTAPTIQNARCRIRRRLAGHLFACQQ